MAIEIKQVSKSFGQTKALRNFSLTIGGQHIYGLLGNNGAGKSTLLNIITDRVRADTGAVTIDGEDNCSDRALGKVFLAGEQNLFPDDMRVKKALRTVAAFYPDFDMTAAEGMARQFGLDLKKKVTALSTGYGSIFRLILGLAVHTPYVFFDEPVLGLDAQHRELFYQLLVERFAQEPCTMMLSTHLIAEAAELIDHAVILRDGQLLCEGSVEDLTRGVCTLSGPAAVLDGYLPGRQVLWEKSLGGWKSACVRGQTEDLPEGVERSGMNLQDYFISLMKEEEQQ